MYYPEDRIITALLHATKELTTIAHTARKEGKEPALEIARREHRLLWARVDALKAERCRRVLAQRGVKRTAD